MSNSQIVSDWYSAHDLYFLATIAKEGDLLEFDKGLHRHWGIFAGTRYENGAKNSYVIHFSEPENVNPFQVPSNSLVAWRKTGIIKERLADVVLHHRVRINNGADKNDLPDGSHAIMRRAEELVGTSDATYGGYTSSNCEDFAAFCRYGQKASLQQVSPEDAAIGLGVLVGGLVGLGLWAAFSGSRSNTRRRERDY